MSSMDRINGLLQSAESHAEAMGVRAAGGASYWSAHVDLKNTHEDIRTYVTELQADIFSLITIAGPALKLLETLDEIGSTDDAAAQVLGLDTKTAKDVISMISEVLAKYPLE